MLAFRAGILKILIKIANREDPDLTASSEKIVCIDLFGRQLVFEIFDHLPYPLSKTV